VFTQDAIQRFIEQIPPAPTVLEETLEHVNSGELVKAARTAEEDPALSSYLKSLVNRPIYGFRNEVRDLSQIFGILGVSTAQQTLYNYMLGLLSPASWSLFGLNAASFAELQDRLGRGWHRILVHLQIDDRETESAITLLPASIIVCEALFRAHKEEVTLLRSVKAIDYNTILQRLCHQDLFDVCARIAAAWEMPEPVSRVVQAASGVKPSEDAAVNTLGKWMHLLLFYELSRPLFIEAGLNDFIDFQVDYVADIYDDFSSVMEIA
jgi:HD-like signal output (HDOD) protein